jgi:hypothetical protein
LIVNYSYLSHLFTFLRILGVIYSPIQNVWSILSTLNFSWWSLVSSATLVHGSSLKELDATIRIDFKDSTVWTVAVRELSSINHSITFEVIESEPATSFSSAVHTISLKRISTGTGSTYIEWITDFSNDVTSDIVVDSSFKRQEAFSDLASVSTA